MPSTSRVQQQATAIAEHAPGKLYARNRGLLKMSHQQLHDFAATKTGNLPDRKGNVKRLSDQLTAMRGAGQFRKAA